ncbi:MAG: rhamnan synthesis F family protein [Verrucomicrobiales bacterium]|nr:rhamnan synthesis F family protein [Verrucomicrobiales bacterium]
MATKEKLGLPVSKFPECASLSKTIREFYLSLFFLTSERKRRKKVIADSGLFDTAFYRKNYRLNLAGRLFPLRHYVVRGEKRGHFPNPNFHPRAYWWKYLPDGADESPLCHFIETGKAQGFDCSPPECEFFAPEVSPPPPSSDRAVVIHLYYHDLWEEMEIYLRRIERGYDLFCTIVSHRQGSYERLRKKIQALKPDAHCYEFPNHGRDIFPFIHLINMGLLDSYSLIAKLHTKKSVHLSYGDSWRQSLLNSIIPENAESLWETFLKNDACLCAVAPGQVKIMLPDGCPNYARTSELAANLSLSIKKPIEFPAGSVYLIKPTIVSGLKEIKLSMEDFEGECGQLDGTTAHAVERLVGHLCYRGNEEGTALMTIDALTQGRSLQEEKPCSHYS